MILWNINISRKYPRNITTKNDPIDGKSVVSYSAFPLNSVASSIQKMIFLIIKMPNIGDWKSFNFTLKRFQFSTIPQIR